MKFLDLGAHLNPEVLLLKYIFLTLKIKSI